MRTGGTVLHLLGVNGVPGKPELNAERWDSVLQCATRLGNTPFIISGECIYLWGNRGRCVIGKLAQPRNPTLRHGSKRSEGHCSTNINEVRVQDKDICTAQVEWHRFPRAEDARRGCLGG